MLFDWLAERARAAAGRPASSRRYEQPTDTTEPTDEPIQLEGTVAIVGFPNVGKSTLVNRLTATRQAVVHETQGTTRDRKELVCEWNGKQFLLIDTGGVDIADPNPITRQIAEQARAAIEEADLVLFVVDARAGVTPGDEELAQILRESKKHVLVLANKIDDPSQETLSLEFHRLGFGEPFPISALHGSNTGDLLDEILVAASRRVVAERRERCDPRRDPRPAERRQVVALQQARRLGAHDRLRDSGHDARHDRHACSSTRAARSSSSTPPAFAASASSGRGSSTTRSCARSRPRSAPTSRSS